MSNILGIDYGEAKVGLAVSSGALAAPLSVIKYSGTNELFGKIGEQAAKERIEKLIVGVSEGKSAEAARDFGKKLSKYLALPVEFVDETLSTKDVQRLAIEAGKGRKRRREMEDAYAAALILQSYLDSQ